jgi:glycosyltransferase involved in cell wall biosynthesis
MTTVSILITSKDERDYLDRSITSALEQTHQPHEIVVVDAASEDGSQSLIQEYEDTHPDLIRGVLLDEDPGIPAMRNIALESATGDLYTFLDADDWFYPEKLEKELATYRMDDDTNIVYSNFEHVDEDGTPQGTWVTDESPPTGDVLPSIISRDWPGDKLWRSSLVEMSLIDEVGDYDEELAVYEDWELMIRLADEATVSYCDDVLSVYRLHEQGVSVRSSAETHVRSLNRIIDKHRPRYANSSDPAISSAFREAERIVRRRGVFAHVSDGNRGKAIAGYLTLLSTHPISVVDYKLHLKTFLPVTVFDQFVRFYHFLSN